MHIRTHFISSALIAGALILGGCATTPDPAKVCTTEWIQPRAQKAVAEVQRETGRTLKSLKKTAEKISDGGALSTFRAAGLLSSVQKLVKSLQDGRGGRDLKTLAATCGNPKILRDGIVGYMEQMEAPKMLMDMVRQLDFEQMTKRAQETTPPVS